MNEKVNSDLLKMLVTSNKLDYNIGIEKELQVGILMRIGIGSNVERFLSAVKDIYSRKDAGIVFEAD